jgi:hypothetical protein
MLDVTSNNALLLDLASQGEGSNTWPSRERADIGCGQQSRLLEASSNFESANRDRCCSVTMAKVGGSLACFLAVSRDHRSTPVQGSSLALLWCWPASGGLCASAVWLSRWRREGRGRQLVFF